MYTLTDHTIYPENMGQQGQGAKYWHTGPSVKGPVACDHATHLTLTDKGSPRGPKIDGFTIWGVPYFAMLCYVFFWKFRLPI